MSRIIFSALLLIFTSQVCSAYCNQYGQCYGSYYDQGYNNYYNNTPLPVRHNLGEGPERILNQMKYDDYMREQQYQMQRIGDELKNFNRMFGPPVGTPSH